jgi:hypothetical protein
MAAVRRRSHTERSVEHPTELVVKLPQKEWLQWLARLGDFPKGSSSEIFASPEGPNYCSAS